MNDIRIERVELRRGKRAMTVSFQADGDGKPKIHVDADVIVEGSFGSYAARAGNILKLLSEPKGWRVHRSSLNRSRGLTAK